VATGKCIHIFKGHSNWVASASYSPNDQRLISASRDTTLKKWDAETGECIQTIFNFSSLLIQGIDMRNLHPDSEISDGEEALLGQYGAMI